jgi:hypothetical protein
MNPTASKLTGRVDLQGILYRIEQLTSDEWQVSRDEDGARVGKVRGSSSSMWLLEAESIEVDLLSAIVGAAIEQGLLDDLPTD